MTCFGCQRVERANSDDPFFLASLRETVAVLHPHQRYEGWCVLWLKDHHEHFGLLPVARQGRIAEDIAQVAAAMHRAFDPIRINYECLGNVVSHIHWHLIPRRTNDPQPDATVWVRPATETDCGCTENQRTRLITTLRKSL